MFNDIQLVIFDLDGTLVDSVPDLAHCVDGMLSRLGKKPAGEALVRTWVGNGIERLVARALQGQMDGEPDQQLFAQALPLFMELYGANSSKHSTLYAGVEETLDWLALQQITLACVTNKASRFTIPILRDLGLYQRFAMVVGGDTLAEKKPSGLPLRHVATELGIDLAHTLMVGDSVTDVGAARAAGLPIVCLSYGYNHGQDIHLAQPDMVIDSLQQLPALLTRSL